MYVTDYRSEYGLVTSFTDFTDFHYLIRMNIPCQGGKWHLLIIILNKCFSYIYVDIDNIYSLWILKKTGVGHSVVQCSFLTVVLIIKLFVHIYLYLHNLHSMFNFIFSFDKENLHVSDSLPNGWTELAEVYWGNICLYRKYIVKNSTFFSKFELFSSVFFNSSGNAGHF